MKAGFAKTCITPPAGTRMMGFWERDVGDGSGVVHDDLYVRCLYLEQGSQAAVIAAFDLCFVGREDADRYKGVIGRQQGLTPAQILISATHTHSSPASGCWTLGDYVPAERLYLQEVEEALVEAVALARERAREVTAWASTGKTEVPMSRRRPSESGTIEFSPHPNGVICDALPVCLFKDVEEKPVACLYSVAAHPSNFKTDEISGDYVGVAAKEIDRYLGAECSLFLQGCAGDAKTAGAGHDGPRWRRNDREMVTAIGLSLGGEVRSVIEAGLQPVETELRSGLMETSWPLTQQPERTELEELAAGFDPGLPIREQETKTLWARRQLELLDRGRELRTHASVLIQGIKLGAGLRLLAIEGEPVSEHGLNVLAHYSEGVTFALGYANGEGLYLPVTRMLEEGGYEVESFWEYSYPAGLAPGMEQVVSDALDALKAQGID